MWTAVGASLKIAALILVFYLRRVGDPRLMALKEEKRSEDERQAFRKALWGGDSDSVSRLLGSRLRRLRAKNHVSDGK